MKKLMFLYLFKIANPKVTWLADIIYNNNQDFEPTDFGTVDCNLSPNIIYYDFLNINFGGNLQLDWMEKSLGESNYILLINNILLSNK